jgi:biopolymer transport protein TolR
VKKKSIISDINITSLADVSITLLVIFIITAPMMIPGIEVNLPRTDASLPHDEEGITVTIKKNRDIFIDNDKVTIDNFEPSLQKILKNESFFRSIILTSFGNFRNTFPGEPK